MATGKKSWENLLVTIYKFYKRILGTYFGQFQLPQGFRGSYNGAPLVILTGHI